LYKAEVANTYWKYVKANLISKDIGMELLQLTQALVDEYVDIGENNTEAYNESIRLHHSAYDMLYFTLARRAGAVLLTLDKSLLELCVNEGVDHL
jgi:predicted nucleic acid-binding protein